MKREYNDGVKYNFKHIDVSKMRMETKEERYKYKYELIFSNPVPIIAFYERKYLREIISPKVMKGRLRSWEN